MTWLGLAHLFLVLTALGIGAWVLGARKGAVLHRALGRLFAALMLISNLLVLGIYEDSPRPGIFHVLAVVSTVSILVAILLLRLRPLRTGYRVAHGHIMLWSYGGVVAAGLGQGANGLGFPPWPVILACLAVTGMVAMRLDIVGMTRRR